MSDRYLPEEPLKDLHKKPFRYEDLERIYGPVLEVLDEKLGDVLTWTEIVETAEAIRTKLSRL